MPEKDKASSSKKRDKTEDDTEDDTEDIVMVNVKKPKKEETQNNENTNSSNTTTTETTLLAQDQKQIENMIEECQKIKKSNDELFADISSLKKKTVRTPYFEPSTDKNRLSIDIKESVEIRYVPRLVSRWKTTPNFKVVKIKDIFNDHVDYPTQKSSSFDEIRELNKAMAKSMTSYSLLYPSNAIPEVQKFKTNFQSIHKVLLELWSEMQDDKSKLPGFQHDLSIVNKKINDLNCNRDILLSKPTVEWSINRIADKLEETSDILKGNVHLQDQLASMLKNAYVNETVDSFDLNRTFKATNNDTEAAFQTSLSGLKQGDERIMIIRSKESDHIFGMYINIREVESSQIMMLHESSFFFCLDPQNEGNEIKLVPLDQYRHKLKLRIVSRNSNGKGLIAFNSNCGWRCIDLSFPILGTLSNDLSSWESYKLFGKLVEGYKEPKNGLTAGHLCGQTDGSSKYTISQMEVISVRKT